MSQSDTDRYEDIIHLPHHVSKVHAPMPLSKRAAQFLPFAALTGYEDLIDEENRLTDEEADLSDEMIGHINRRLAILASARKQRPVVTITYFVPDLKKDGGACHVTTGVVKKVDHYARTVHMEDGTSIPVWHIMEIDGSIFEEEDA